MNSATTKKTGLYCCNFDVEAGVHMRIYRFIKSVKQSTKFKFLLLLKCRDIKFVTPY